jgi:hypothetical protein
MGLELRYYLALIHYPVHNKEGEVVVSSITNLDIHDLSRLVKTYGGKAFYMVTPLESQRAMIGRICAHWKEGFGATYNPNRGEALELVRVSPSLEEMREDIREEEGEDPLLAATSAREQEGKRVPYRELGRVIQDGMRPVVVVLGTGWGLTQEVIRGCHYLLEPIKGMGRYNHLSVRCAAAIVLDRLFVGRKEP